MKLCPACKEEKTLEDFHIARKRFDGRQYKCKTCTKEASYKYYQDMTEEERKEYNARRYKAPYQKHGLTKEQHQAMLNDQSGLCAICEKEKATHIDHNHECCPGQFGCPDCVRGILCFKCNTAIGLLSDSVESARNIILYLTR